MNKPKTKKYGSSEYRVLTHGRVKAYYTLIDRGDHKTIHSFDIPNLMLSTIKSTELTAKMARIFGEIFLTIAEELEN